GEEMENTVPLRTAAREDDDRRHAGRHREEQHLPEEARAREEAEEHEWNEGLAAQQRFARQRDPTSARREPHWRRFREDALRALREDAGVPPRIALDIAEDFVADDVVVVRDVVRETLVEGVLVPPFFGRV